MNPSRRHFLKTASIVAAGFGGLQNFAAERSKKDLKKLQAKGYGPLIKDPAGVIDLPEGFTYTTFSKWRDKMDDGLLVPTKHDGMGAFPGPNGLTILVRNHENSPARSGDLGAFGPGHRLMKQEHLDMMYDQGTKVGDILRIPCLGGTTTIVYDTKKQKMVRHFLSLAGTIRNCAGGNTPWNSWITSEESTERAGNRLSKDHGYNFEVPATITPKLADPIPLRAMGRFNHEAVAVDPKTGIVYQTEDQGDSLIYRFIPDVPEQLAKGGKLQALVVNDKKGLDTRNWFKPTVRTGDEFKVSWVDIEDVESPKDDLREQGYAKGAARFARGEGMWYGHNSIYFAATNGGEKQRGQIWRLTLGENDNISMDLFAMPDEQALVDMADNLTVSPYGGLILCEDGPGEQYLRGVTTEGKFFNFAKNRVLPYQEGRPDPEFCGATFSPDGSTLFVNIQYPGITLAITGPWKTLKS